MKTTETLKTDLKILVEYLWESEKKHYEESDKPKEHIFNVLKRIKKFLTKER